MPFAPGDTFDRYTIEAVVGEGGMGTVYRAYDPRLDRRVALKVLRTDRAEGDATGEEADARIMREARVAAALEHANCVAIFDFGEHQGARFIAMEFVDGSPLRRFVGDASVPLEQKTKWLVDTARALSFAHKRGLIHRDVKPENVMVRADGAVKVLDFGIAKRAAGEPEPGRPFNPHDSGERSSLAPSLDLALAETAAGVVAGTPLYMAPEQIRKMPLDARADQFAWGVMAYELLTGHHPFRSSEADGGQKVLLAILSDAPTPIAQIAPKVPAVVQATVQRALAKPRRDRFASMDDIVAALEPFAGAMSGRSVGLGSAPSIDSVKTELAMPIDAPYARGKKKGAKGRVLAASATIAVACAGIAAVAMRSRPDAPGTNGTPHVTLVDAADGRGLAMTEVDAPASRSADALAAYREGLQSFRAASFEAARQGFARAVALDPAMAAAHLRTALLDSLVADETAARGAFRRAVELRASLAPRDSLLLDAFEPYLQREPSEVGESVKRLEAAVAARPDDSEIHLFLGTVLWDAGEAKRAEASFDRAIALDPEFAQAWSYRGSTEAFLGEFDDALASFDKCLAVSIGATDCLWDRVLIFDDRGQCKASEADARTWIAKAPDDGYAYHELARDLFALGRDEAPVRAALEQAWAHDEPSARDRARAGDEMKLALLRGDFQAARARGAEVEKALASEPVASAHATLASFLVDLDGEMGRTAEAGKIAADYLAKRDAWVAPTRVDDIAIGADLTPSMLAAEAGAHLITPSELASRRDEWARAWGAKTSRAYLGHVWIYGYAMSAFTPRDAELALEALPTYAPLPPFVSASLAPELAIGRVYLLAGRPADAIPHLERAARSCVMLDEPLSEVRARLLLGRAREATGDTKGACDAYAEVARRWGDAKPRSLSADEAKHAKKRLACPPSHPQPPLP